MTPDEITKLIFDFQNELNPDDDPGDLTISVQDDMPLVTIYQEGTQNFAGGTSIAEALSNFYDIVRYGATRISNLHQK